MPISIISNNPFRVLGVFSNSSIKDIVANGKKAKAYVKVGRSPSFLSDFDTILPTIKRTAEAIDAAQAQINQTNDRVKYALFWYAKGSPSDDEAFGHLYNRNFSKAKVFFRKNFELCESKSDYQKYIVSFGSEAKHAAEAEEHLKFDRMMEKVQDYFNEHLKYFFSILILLVLIAIGIFAGISYFFYSLFAIIIIVGIIHSEQ